MSEEKTGCTILRLDTTQRWGSASEGQQMSFGERLRKIRTEQGWTAKELSAASGVQEKTIYRIETGEVADPRLSSVIPLVKALNCSADELVLEKTDFTKLGELRRVFQQFADMEPYQQTFLLEVVQKLNLAFILEDNLNKGTRIPMPDDDQPVSE